MTNKFVTGYLIVCCLLMALASVMAVTMGACEGILDAPIGSAYMPCHWSYLVTAVACGIATILFLVGLISRSYALRIYLSGAVIVCVLVAAIVMFTAIGVCADETMVCNAHRVFCMGPAFIVGVSCMTLIILPKPIEEGGPNPHAPKPEEGAQAEGAQAEGAMSAEGTSHE